jgi:hypothetical protein
MARKQGQWALLVVVCLAAHLNGCLNYPRDNQVVASKATAVSFEGWYYDASNVEIRPFVKNNVTNTFDAIPHAPLLTGTSPHVDNAGDTWYSFSAADVIIPAASQYWSAGAGRTLVARVKVVGPGNQEIVSFDAGSDTDTCINTQLQTGGNAVMTQCKSSTSPVVRLIVPCGASGADCCVSGSACDFGNNCSAGLCSLSCGAQGQGCCNTSPACSSGNACTGGTCAACTTKGASCSSSAQCCNGLTCGGGVCKPPCTPGAACTVPGKQGSCAKGQLSCAGLDPVCTQVVSPQPDTNCNGVDDDCDGSKDEDYATHACNTTPDSCQAGFSVPGKSACHSGSESCEADENVDYCGACGTAACGACAATPCTPGVTKCAPGYVCKTGATMGCGISDSSTACWPIDGGHCNGCGPSKTCWKPAEVTVGGVCQ